MQSQGRVPRSRSANARNSSSRSMLSACTEPSLRGQRLLVVDEEDIGDSVEEEAGETSTCPGIPYRPNEMLQVWIVPRVCRIGSS
jgi:hypothetical protein